MFLAVLTARFHLALTLSGAHGLSATFITSVHSKLIKETIRQLCYACLLLFLIEWFERIYLKDVIHSFRVLRK